VRVKDISVALRPREKMLQGLYLDDAELLALILEKGSKNENVIELSHRLINEFNLLDVDLFELMKIKGIGVAKACKLVACFKLVRRLNSGKIMNVVLNKPKDVANYYMHKIGSKKKEFFYAVFLDTKNKVICDKLISIGTLDSSLVHPREIFKEAVRVSAASLILVHNHPSGDCTASEEDLKVTSIVSKAGEMIGVKLLDHVVVSVDDWWSWKK